MFLAPFRPTPWLLSCAAAFCLGASRAPLTVEQAYATFSHARPAFQATTTTAPSEEAAYLQQLFAIIDQIVVHRVTVMQWLAAQSPAGTFVPDQYDSLLYQLETLQAPPRLAPVQQRVLQAVRAQREIVQDWREEKDGDWQRLAGDARVQQASRVLHEAYGLVMRLYPQEASANRQAFYSYFCCLDLI